MTFCKLQIHDEQPLKFNLSVSTSKPRRESHHFRHIDCLYKSTASGAFVEYYLVIQNIRHMMYKILFIPFEYTKGYYFLL